MTDLPILYSFRRCPYAMRARMALVVSGIEVELREVVLRDKPSALLAASPKGTVPVLVQPDGTVIEESIDIMRWALAHNDPEHWLGRDEILIQENDGAFKSALDRYKYPGRYSLNDIEGPRDQGFAFLAKLEAVLTVQPFLGGVSRGLADIALLPFVRQYAATDPHWFATQPLCHLQNWLASCVESALFMTVMTRYAQWHGADKPVYFPI